MKKKMPLMALIGITIAFFGSVRSVPMVASTGWAQIFYMLVASLLFALPIALMSAELSTIWTDAGGPQVWVSNALGEGAGFLTSWLLWVQMFFGMVMLSSTFSTMLSEVLRGIAPDHVIAALRSPHVVFITILALYWLVTLLNLKLDMTKISGGWGTIVGVYIPFLAITGLGIAYFCMNGIDAGSYLGSFSPDKLIPNFRDLSSLSIFAAIAFIFAGVEMSSVHVNEIENPGKNYPIAVIVAVLAIVGLNMLAGLGYANTIQAGALNAADVMQEPDIIFGNYIMGGRLAVFDNLLALCILVGIFVALSAWVLGPSKAMQHVADEGALPRFFQKRDKNGKPVNLVLTQAIVVSIIACIFLVPGIGDNIGSVFTTITITTMLIYCAVYLMIAVSAIRLRLTKPDLPRVFRLGKKGNGLMILVAGISIVVTALIMVISFIPPAQNPMGSGAMYVLFQLAALAVAVGSGLMIYKFRKPEWKQDKPKGEQAK